jgi:hypothetical protein
MKIIKIIKWHIYCYLLNRKQRICYFAGFPKDLRQLEKRKYLTRAGIKDYTELTIDDMVRLNIAYPYKDYISNS